MLQHSFFVAPTKYLDSNLGKAGRKLTRKELCKQRVLRDLP